MITSWPQYIEAAQVLTALWQALGMVRQRELGCNERRGLTHQLEHSPGEGSPLTYAGAGMKIECSAAFKCEGPGIRRRIARRVAVDMNYARDVVISVASRCVQVCVRP